MNNYTSLIPADILLKLYAYYKIANKNLQNSRSKTSLINAFKADTLFQIQNMSEKQAMMNYIDLVNQEIRKQQ